MFDECRDDELMAIAGRDVKGSVSALVLTINLSSYKHINTAYMYVFLLKPSGMKQSANCESSHHFE